MTTDVVLNRDNGYYDLTWSDSGDIETAATLDTAILMSIFEELRATPGEQPVSELRRGWLGNEGTGFEQGSKLWEFEQERITGSMLAELGVVIRNALQWLLDDGIAKSITVETPTLENGRVGVRINFGRDESTVDRRYYQLWDNTGPGLIF